MCSQGVVASLLWFPSVCAAVCSVSSTTLSVSVSGAVVFSFAGSFDRAPSDAVGSADELALRHASTRAGSLSFTNCAYSARMLYFTVVAAEGRPRDAATAVELSFFSAAVYEDEVRVCAGVMPSHGYGGFRDSESLTS